MMLRTRLILAAFVAGGALATVPAAAATQQEPEDNMWTRSATLYLSQAQSNPNPEQKQARYQEALDAAREGIENRPDNATSYYQAGRALVGLNDFLAADSMLTSAEELWPDMVEETVPVREFAWVQAYNMAIPAINAGNQDEALAQLERAQIIFQGRPEAMLNLGSLYTQRGDTEKATEVYTSAIEVIRGPALAAQDSVTQQNWIENEQIAVFNLAQLHAAAERYPEAAELYDSYLERNPGNVDALGNLAIVMINMEMPDSAQAIYEELLNKPDMGTRDFFNVGIGLFQGEQYELAAMAFQKVVDVAPMNRDATYNLSQVLYLMEDYERLVPISTTLLELDPYNVNSHTFYVRGLLMSGDSEEAQVAYDHMEAMPIEVYDLQVQPRSNGGMVSGMIENRASEEGATVGVRMHFLDEEGEEVGTADVDVQLTSLETSAPFQAEVTADRQVMAYWYEVTTEIPVVEVPEAEADTTGTTGN